jgi:REP element-mobilizing transposase RayT
MARKLRIQYEGAIYHVINRGNYRRDVFESVGTAQAFEQALMEACTENGWRLHAFVIMRNHYHLAVETPRANLVEGMHWLQSTFSTRFNRFRQERGHLFQGRYQALLIEDMAALAKVVDYIHLNPARAKIVPPERLGEFRWSSLRRFLRGPRTAELCCQDWLAEHGLSDTPKGLQAYADRLSALAGDEAEQKRLGLEQLSKGWAIGTAGWCRTIAKEHADRALAPGMESTELRSLKEARWTQVLEEELDRHKQTHETAAASRANASWKLGIAQQLRNAGAPYAWITRQLHMGSVSTVRVYLNRLKSSK